MSKISGKIKHDFQAFDIFGNEIFPGNLIAISPQNSSAMAVGIVVSIHLSNPSRYNTVDKKIGITCARYHYNSKLNIGERILSSISYIYDEQSVVLIGNPLFNIGVKNVEYILENSDAIKKKWFDDNYILGKQFTAS